MKINIIKSSLIIALIVLTNTTLYASERHNQTYKLLKNHIISIAEGENEPRSIGSYTIKLYSLRNTEFPYDNFLTGVVRPRDGTIEKVVIQDITGDKKPEITISIRCAGSGGYLSVD